MITEEKRLHAVLCNKKGFGDEISFFLSHKFVTLLTSVVFVCLFPWWLVTSELHSWLFFVTVCLSSLELITFHKPFRIRNFRPRELRVYLNLVSVKPELQVWLYLATRMLLMFFFWVTGSCTVLRLFTSSLGFMILRRSLDFFYCGIFFHPHLTLSKLTLHFLVLDFHLI